MHLKTGTTVELMTSRVLHVLEYSSIWVPCQLASTECEKSFLLELRTLSGQDSKWWGEALNDCLYYKKRSAEWSVAQKCISTASALLLPDHCVQWMSEDSEIIPCILTMQDKFMFPFGGYDTKLGCYWTSEISWLIFLHCVTIYDSTCKFCRTKFPLVNYSVREISPPPYF